MTCPKFEQKGEDTSVIVRQKNQRKAERKRPMVGGHCKELGVLHYEAHVPDGDPDKPDGAYEEDQIAVSPRVQLVNVCVEVDHPEGHVKPICELTEALAVIPAVDQIFLRVLTIVVPSVIWNVEASLQVLQATAELHLFFLAAFKHHHMPLICFSVGGTWPENPTQQEH